MLSHKGSPENSVQNELEKNPDEGILYLIKSYPETFCSTTIEDIKTALADSLRDNYKVNFNLTPKTYVTHQGMAIFYTTGASGRPYLARNPLIIEELKKAEYSVMTIRDPAGDGGVVEQGTPFANPVDNVDKKIPYIGTFLKSGEASQTNQRIERNQKIETVDKDAQYMSDEDFKKRVV